MATIQSNQTLKPIVCNPLKEVFGKERFIGLEIETLRNVNALPNYDNWDWHINPWSDDELDEEEINELNAILDPKSRIIALQGQDGADIELATNPISLRALRFDPDVQYFLRRIKEKCLVADESGTHIHVSKLDTDKRNLWRNLYYFSIIFDKQLYRIFRRNSNWAKSPRGFYSGRKSIKLEDFKSNDKLDTYGIKGTLIVNRKNTYECRGGSASTDPTEIKAWAELFYNIVEFCNKQTIVGHRFEEVLPEGNMGELLKTRLTGEQQRQIVPLEYYL